MTIQRCVRRFLTRRGVIKGRLVTYLGNELYKLKKLKHFESHQLLGSSLDNEPFLRPPPPYGLKKIKFFTKVLDQHILTDISDIAYGGSWA